MANNPPNLPMSAAQIAAILGPQVGQPAGTPAGQPSAPGGTAADHADAILGPAPQAAPQAQAASPSWPLWARVPTEAAASAVSSIPIGLSSLASGAIGSLADPYYTAKTLLAGGTMRQDALDQNKRFEANFAWGAGAATKATDWLGLTNNPRFAGNTTWDNVAQNVGGAVGAVAPALVGEEAGLAGEAKNATTLGSKAFRFLKQIFAKAPVGADAPEAAQAALPASVAKYIPPVSETVAPIARTALQRNSTLLAASVVSGAATTLAQKAGAPQWVQYIAGVAPYVGEAAWGALATKAAAANAAQETAQKAAENVNAANAAINEAKGNPIILAEAKAQLRAAQAASHAALAQGTATSAAMRDTQIAAVNKAAQERSAQADAATTALASQHGASATYESAGKAMQAHAQTWLDKAAESNTADSAAIRSLVPEGTLVTADATRAALARISTRGGPFKDAVQAIQSSLPTRLHNSLDLIAQRAEGMPEEPATYENVPLPGPNGELAQTMAKPPVEAIPPEPLTFSGLLDLKRAIGSSLENPAIGGSMDAGDKKAIYAALAQDVTDTTDRVSPEATSAYNTLNTNMSRRLGIRNGLVADWAAPNDQIEHAVLPGAAVQKTLGVAVHDSQHLNLLAQEGFPVRELTAAVLRKDPSVWAKLAPESKAALSSNPAAIDTALGAKAQVQTDAEQAIASAKNAHKQRLDTMQQAAETKTASDKLAVDKLAQQHQVENINNKAYLQSATQRAAETRAALGVGPKQNDAARIMQLIQNGATGAVAGAVVKGLEPHMAFANEMTSLAEGAGVGGGIYYGGKALYNTGKLAASNPDLLNPMPGSALNTFALDTKQKLKRAPK